MAARRTGAGSTRGSRARPRLDRAIDQGAHESEANALSIAREALPEIMGLAVKAAKEGDKQAMRMVLDVAQDELKRARSQGAVEMLEKLAQIRGQGSPTLEKVWKQTIGQHAVLMLPPV